MRAQRAQHAYAREELGILLLLAIFLPIETILHPHNVGQPHVSPHNHPPSLLGPRMMPPLSASFRFFRALFCPNLCVSSSSQAWGNPPPSMSFGMCFPLPTFKIYLKTEGALGRSGR